MISYFFHWPRVLTDFLPLQAQWVNAAGAPSIEITALLDKSKVLNRPVIEGTMSKTFEVWIIVHPLEVTDFWVQRVSVFKGNVWQAQIHVGRSGKLDIGKKFEIMAVGNAHMSLNEGRVLHGWPNAKAKSSIIRVIRK